MFEMFTSKMIAPAVLFGSQEVLVIVIVTAIVVLILTLGARRR